MKRETVREGWCKSTKPIFFFFKYIYMTASSPSCGIRVDLSPRYTDTLAVVHRLRCSEVCEIFVP